MRALHDLLHGRLVEALGYNALLVLVLPIAVVVAARAVFSRAPARWLPAWVPSATLVLLAVWTIARNVPYWPLSALAP